MKPIDFRNDTFDHIKRTWLAARRWDVYCAFLNHGPGTTREIAQKSGIDLLTLRPRVTELCEAGFMALVDGQERGHEGIYYARTVAEFEAWRATQRERATSAQQQLL
jgi:predicted transcriptional regulator